MQKKYEQDKERLKIDIKNALLDKETTIKELEQKIMVALQNKDRTIQDLQSRLQESTIRATHFEKLLEKQRAELLEAL
jgi:hypothetical protein